MRWSPPGAAGSDPWVVWSTSICSVSTRPLRCCAPGSRHRLEVASRVAELLDHLPLAVEQATAYLERTGMDPPPTPTLADPAGRHACSAGADPQRGEKTVGTLWQLSLDRLAAANPAAVPLIEICAHLAPEPIPLDLFTGHASELPEPLASTAADVLLFGETLGSLNDYSLLLSRTAETITFHRLLQAVVRRSADVTAHRRR